MGFKYIDELATDENVRTFLNLADMVAGTGLETANVFDIEDSLRDSHLMVKCLEAVRKDPDSARLLAERYMGEEFDLKKMLKMPRNSLGWTYARVLSAMNYNPQFYRIREIHSDIDYVTHRIRKTHDLHHIVTGFSFDDFGEMGVISVTVGQIGYPAFILIDMLGSLIDYLVDTKTDVIDDRLEYNFDLISEGIRIARQSKPLFAVKWEEGLERSLDEWRDELNIQPLTTGLWSWYSRPLLQQAINLD
jgi:ubiquinone biosynthesis protein COQ4